MLEKEPEERKQKQKAEKQKAKPWFTKKENALIAQRIEVLNWHHKSINKSQTKTAAHWNNIYPNLQLKQPTISAWLKEKEKWCVQFAEVESKGEASWTKWVKQPEHPEVNEMLELWVAKAITDGVYVNGAILHQKWTQFANLVGVPKDEWLNLSEGWLTAFKRHCGLKEFKKHSEAGSVGAEDVENECMHVQELIIQYK